MPNYLWAVYSNNGTVKWRFRTGNHIDSSPAIGSDGTIYFGDWNGWVHALNPDGTLKWQYLTGDIITASPAIGPNGSIYIGSQDDNLYAFNPNGTVKWTFHTGGWVRVSPCIGDDGTVYCVSLDNYLYAIRPDGTMKWRFNVGAGTNPTIGPDGTIYAGWNTLYAINPDGTLKWSLPLNGAMEGSTPCTSHEGIIYFGTTSNKVYAVNPDGTIRWENNFSWSQSPAAIGEDGTLYIGSSSYLRAFGLGPLHAEANGPYIGAATVPIQLSGTVFGGIPPYMFQWDFGDNHSSTEQNPTHAYLQRGTYTATFTITDSTGNQSIDHANITVGYAPPKVTILKPVNGTYFMNHRIASGSKILIIGPITIEAEASSANFSIDYVEFWVWNGNHYSILRTDKTPPYSFTWRLPYFGKTGISAKAVDTSGNYTYADEDVWRFF